jgi:cellulose synthase/poly-beta-1,6-N-acetylglucosamine synthase-like glycosyltransferase
VGGFGDLSEPLSGDDDLFVQLVSRRTTWKLRYAFEPQAVVETDAPATIRDFLNQERRRTSKGRHYPFAIQATVAAVFFMNLGLTITVPMALIGIGTGWIPLLALGLKISCELALLLKACHLLGVKKVLWHFPPVAILHPLYFLLFSIWGTLGNYRWKTGHDQSGKTAHQFTPT